jgi:hypothetical protein
MKKILTTLLGMTMIANSSVVVSCDWNDRGDIVVGGDIVVDFYENGFEQLGTYFPPIVKLINMISQIVILLTLLMPTELNEKMEFQLIWINKIATNFAIVLI